MSVEEILKHIVFPCRNMNEFMDAYFLIRHEHKHWPVLLDEMARHYKKMAGRKCRRNQRMEEVIRADLDDLIFEGEK